MVTVIAPASVTLAPILTCNELWLAEFYYMLKFSLELMSEFALNGGEHCIRGFLKKEIDYCKDSLGFCGKGFSGKSP